MTVIFISATRNHIFNTIYYMYNLEYKKLFNPGMVTSLGEGKLKILIQNIKIHV